MSRGWLSATTSFLLFVGVVLVWANYSGSPLPNGAQADLVVIEKAKRILTLYFQGKVLKTYQVSLGRLPGRKEREGDKRTPEGTYVVDYRKADSGYFRALHISYPNRADAEAAKTSGVAPGGMIMIHGLRNGFGWVGKLHRLVNWTLGCIAVTDQEMDELWRAVPNGTRVELKP